MSTQVTCLLHCVSASLTSLCFLVAFRHRWKEPVFSCIQCSPVLNSCAGEALPHYSVLKDKNTDLGKWINNIYWSGKGRTQISSSSGLVSSLVYCSKLALLLASTIQNPRGKSCCSFNPRKNGFTAESVLCPKSHEYISHKYKFQCPKLIKSIKKPAEKETFMNTSRCCSIFEQSKLDIQGKAWGWGLNGDFCSIRYKFAFCINVSTRANLNLQMQGWETIKEK